MDDRGIHCPGSKVRDPFHKPVQVPPAIANAMANIARLDPKRVEERRKRSIAEWRNRKEKLRPQEKEIKSKLDPDVA